MLHAKQALKRKRRSKAVAVLGAAGLLSLAGVSAQAAGPAADIPARHIDPSHQLMLSGSNPPEESDTPSHISF
jgi:hypothetical protein